MASRKRTNKNVSVLSGISWRDRAEIAKLKVIPRIHQGSSRSSAIAWHHIGELHFQKEEIIDGQTETRDILVDPDHFYCQVCLIKEQGKYEKAQNGHVSRVARYKRTTSTYSMNEHLETQHDIRPKKSLPSTSSQMSMNQFLRKDKVLPPAQSTCEIAEDIALWFALDLKPFSSIEQKGFKFFMAKNIPQIELPDEGSVRRTALRKLYSTLKDEVTEEICKAPAICLLFDGWTDKYKARGYLGLRVMYITEWEPRIVTLSCKSLDSHTAESICKHVRAELASFIDDPSGIKLFSTHDGASNMKKTSRLLKVKFNAHCSAHVLNLLLVSDGIERTESLVDLIEKCQRIVKTLSFKGHIIEDELANSYDRDFIENVMNRVSAVEQELSLDDQFALEKVP